MGAGCSGGDIYGTRFVKSLLVALLTPSARYSEIFRFSVPRLMTFRHSLLLCGVGLCAVGAAFGQNPPRGATGSEPARALPAAQPPASTAARAVAEPIAPKVPAGPQITFNSVHVDGPYIAMTFDDGPHATLTPKLLDLLAARKLKATFFIVGQCAAEYPEIMKRIAREGHELANHSWSHPNLAKMSDDAVRRELQRTDDAIRAAAGERTTLIRPPYGSITPRQKQWINEVFGYRIIIWDVDPLDWKRPGVGVVRDRIVTRAKPGSIILAHDIHASTIEAMPGTFDELLAKGFKFVTVSELLAMAKPKPPAPPAPPRALASPAPVTHPTGVLPPGSPAPAISSQPAAVTPDS